MMHYPCTFKRGEERFPRDAEGKMILGKTSFVDTWKAMEKLVKTGKVKAIGVSNFSQGEVQQLLDSSDTVSLLSFNTGFRDLIRFANERTRYQLSCKWKCTHTYSKKASTHG